MKDNTRLCNMCGNTTKIVVKRYFRYDSGKTFVEWICEPCSDLHATLVIRAGA